MARIGVGRLAMANTQFFLCDVQEKFRGSITYMPAVIEVARRLVRGLCFGRPLA